MTRDADLAAFYDQEAPERADRPLGQQREDHRRQFTELMASEGRSRIIEIGSGVGRDAAPMIDAGLSVTVVDLSFEGVRRCRLAGASGVVGSVAAMPWSDGAFEGGYTMSALLHLSDDEVGGALAEIVRVLAAGSPLAVGVWGGENRVTIAEHDVYEPKRFYAFRSDEVWEELLSKAGHLEAFETWPSENEEDAGLHYQWAVLRVP